MSGVSWPPYWTPDRGYFGTRTAVGSKINFREYSPVTPLWNANLMLNTLSDIQRP